MDFIAAQTINAATADFMHSISTSLSTPSILLAQIWNVNIEMMLILFLMNVKPLYLCRCLVSTDSFKESVFSLPFLFLLSVQ